MNPFTVLSLSWWSKSEISLSLVRLGFGLSLLFILTALIIKYRPKPKLKIVEDQQNRWLSLFLYCGLALLMVSFFHWQNLSGLNSRLLFAAIGIIFLTVSFGLIIYWLTNYQLQKTNEIHQKILKQYIPNKKDK